MAGAAKPIPKRRFNAAWNTIFTISKTGPCCLISTSWCGLPRLWPKPRMLTDERSRHQVRRLGLRCSRSAAVGAPAPRPLVAHRLRRGLCLYGAKPVRSGVAAYHDDVRHQRPDTAAGLNAAGAVSHALQRRILG